MNDKHEKLSNDPDYSFLEHFELNAELLEYLSSKNLPAHIFTTGVIQDIPDIQKDLGRVVTKKYTTSQIGFDKGNPEAYKAIAKDVGVPPNTILFVDDRLENVEAARNAGLTAIHYRSNGQLFKELNSVFS